MTRPVLYFDVGSPFVYLAAERIERVLGVDPVWQPILLGGLFKATGRSSWARGDADRRAAGIRNIEARRAAVAAPDASPRHSVSTMTSAIRVCKRQKNGKPQGSGRKDECCV